MIVDGRAIASAILEDVRSGHTGMPVVRAVVVAPSAATESYLSIKAARAKEAGMTLEVVRLMDDATPEDVIAAVQAPGADAVIVQLPLPDHLDQTVILDSIPERADADVLARSTYERFLKGETGARMPPVAAAVAEILSQSGVSVEGKRAVVVGQGRLVGEPAAAFLRNHGASVEVMTREQGDLSLLTQADIIVSGAGSPGLIRPEYLKEGVVLIDAGTSEQGGAIVGDADPACAAVASVFTPVPGGVGPVAVACLFRNVLSRAPSAPF